MRSYDTPMLHNFHEEQLAHSEAEVKYIDSYSKLVGSLLYLSNRTRPDISLATSLLAQHMTKPNEFLMKAANRVVGYLKKTNNYGLEYIRKDEKFSLYFYVDADFGGDQQTRKSRTGWQGFLNGNIFTWIIQRQQSTALSTAESEYVAISECYKEVKRVRLILSELGMNM